MHARGFDMTLTVALSLTLASTASLARAADIHDGDARVIASVLVNEQGQPIRSRAERAVGVQFALWENGKFRRALGNRTYSVCELVQSNQVVAEMNSNRSEKSTKEIVAGSGAFIVGGFTSYFAESAAIAAVGLGTGGTLFLAAGAGYVAERIGNAPFKTNGIVGANYRMTGLERTATPAVPYLSIEAHADRFLSSLDDRVTEPYRREAKELIDRANDSESYRKSHSQSSEMTVDEVASRRSQEAKDRGRAAQLLASVSTPSAIQNKALSSCATKLTAPEDYDARLDLHRRKPLESHPAGPTHAKGSAVDTATAR